MFYDLIGKTCEKVAQLKEKTQRRYNDRISIIVIKRIACLKCGFKLNQTKSHEQERT